MTEPQASHRDSTTTDSSLATATPNDAAAAEVTTPHLQRPILLHQNKSLPSPSPPLLRPDGPSDGPLASHAAVQPSPAPEAVHDAEDSAEAQAASAPFVARRPFHRSLSVPLNTRLGALRHPGGGVGLRGGGAAAASTTTAGGAEASQAAAGSAAKPLSSVGEESLQPASLAQHNAQNGSGQEGETQGSSSASAQSAPAVTTSERTLEKIAEAAREAVSVASGVAQRAVGKSASAPLLSHPQSGTEARQSGSGSGEGTLTSYSTLVADTLQLPISTLLQVIPPHLLDPSHERLSAMSLQVPVTSVEALLEACRNLNWICARMGSNINVNSLDAQLGSAVASPATASAESGLPAAAPASGPASESTGRRMVTSSSSSSLLPIDSIHSSIASSASNDFDLLEMTQRVADAVAGQAAEQGVDLVLFEGGDVLRDGSYKESDGAIRVGLSVRGDEGAIRFAMMHVISRSIASALPGASIELGHVVTTLPTEAETAGGEARFTFRVTLLQPKAAAEAEANSKPPQAAKVTLSHPPSLTLLSGLGATLTVSELASSDAMHCAGIQQSIVLPLTLGAPLVEAAHREAAETEARQRFLPALKLAEEPSAQELATFVSQDLRGKRIALHASPTSVFAKHLSQTLATFDCETAHLPLEGASDDGQGLSWTGPGSEGETRAPRTAFALSRNKPSLVHYPSDVGMGTETTKARSASEDTAVLDPITGVPVVLPPSPMEMQGGAADDDDEDAYVAPSAASRAARRGSQIMPFSFIMIDDDIDTLQRELLRMRSAISLLHSAMTPSPLGGRSPTRTNFALHPQLAKVRSNSLHPHPRRQDSGDSTQAIIYFTSLRNFRVVRDAIQPIIESSYAQTSAAPLPEVMVIPKPAGVRRLLTAMHTAVHKPLVDPFFSPIATSPMSPISANRAVVPAPAALPSPGIVEGPNDSLRAPSLLPSPAKPSASAGKHPSLHLSLPPRNATAVQPQASPATLPDVNDSTAETKPTSSEPSVATERDATMAAAQAATSLQVSGAGSPMRLDALGYFSETAARMGSRGASGMVIQSPDGRPAGIFFQPKTSSHGSRTPASQRRSSGENSPPRRSEIQSEARRWAESRRGPVGGDEGPRSAHAAGSRSSKRKGSAAGSETGGSTQGQNDWAYTYAPGSLFTPQVAIESVLSGSRPPMATPMDEVARRPLDPSDWEKVGYTPPVSKPASTAGRNAAQSAVESPVTRTGPAASGSESRAPEKEPKAAQPATPLPSVTIPVKKPVRTVKDGLLSPATPTTPLDAAANARQSFAQPKEPGPRRPSAQPQSGLLIGAGFTPTTNKGRGLKRAPIREKVLPPIKVLIVEDNPINLSILSKFMKRKKISFDVARDGREAVDKWQTGGFHLILMDIQLPVMDGIEATKEIRKLERSENIGIVPSTPPASQVGSALKRELDAPPSAATTPVSPSPTPFRASVIIVALTASVLNSDRVAALAAGCNDFLNKPVDLNWLERKLWEWGSIQYIVLSGQLRAAGAPSLGPGRSAASALAMARENSEVRRGFGSGPDVLARKVASSLHINRKRSPAPSSPVKGGVVPNVSVTQAAPTPAPATAPTPAAAAATPVDASAAPAAEAPAEAPPTDAGEPAPPSNAAETEPPLDDASVSEPL